MREGGREGGKEGNKGGKKILMIPTIKCIEESNYLNCNINKREREGVTEGGREGRKGKREGENLNEWAS